MRAHARILLVEDEALTATILRELLEAHGHSVRHCSDGEDAWLQLDADSTGIDVILLDRNMPKLDGMGLLKRIKQDPRLVHIPVILETVQSDQESILEGLRQGAYYYLTKPWQPQVLLAVVQTALHQFEEVRHLIERVRCAQRPLSLFQTGSFSLRNMEEGRLLANYLAHVCPEPERAILGLQELLVNAIEHGNLEISYAEKGRLLLAGEWQREIERRLQWPQFRERRVEVRFDRDPGFLRFTIIDQGQGFDWRSYLDFAPERAFDLHGRGIAMAGKFSFDALQYHGAGNVVTAIIHTPVVAV
ncbi:MAG: response regulator [Magnetococcales bacterium]|nr:response regulator [Magnetococcales bacterium]